MRQQGSTAITILIALTSVSMSYLYVSNLTSKQKQGIDKAALQSGRELSEISDINTLARFRSLIGSRKISDGVYKPAVYPSNYFDTAWKTTPNQPVIELIDKNKGTIQVLNDGVKFSKITSSNTFDDQVKVLKGESSATKFASADQTVSIEKVNFKDEAPGTLATSVDVKLTDKDNRKTYARIPVEMPIPHTPILEMRREGSSSWTRNFSQMDPGMYELRVLASGVVLGAEVWINGQKRQTLGWDPATGNITHKAVNIQAENEVIGSFQFPFESFDFDRPGCLATPIDGLFNYEVRLLAADGHVQNGGIATGPISLKPHLNTTDLTFDEFRNICSEQCPYFSDVQQAEIGNPALQVRTGNFQDYSWLINWDWTTKHLSAKNYKICENIENLVATSKIRERPDYQSMTDQQISDHLRSPWGWDVEKDYFAYQKGACNVRRFLFVRGECGCFATGTQIRMEDGSEKPIDQLQETDRVWNPLAKKGQGIRRMTRGPEKVPLFRIASQGKEVVVTGTHPFATKKGLMSAYQLEIGDEIQSVAGDWGKIESIDMQTPVGAQPIVWNLELDGPNDDPDSHFVEANGLVTGDLLLQTKLQNK